MTRRPPSDYVRIGRLGRSFKLSGGVRLRLDNADLLGRYHDTPPHGRPGSTDIDETADAVLDALDRLFVPGLGETRLRDHEFVSGSPVIYLEGVRDRTAARALVNAEVWAAVGDVPPTLVEELTAPTPEEELVGLVVTVGSRRVGTVTAAHLGGSNDYVEAELDTGGTALLPLTAPYVTLTGSSLTLVDPPPGLLND